MGGQPCSKTLFENLPNPNYNYHIEQIHIFSVKSGMHGCIMQPARDPSP